MNIRQASGGPGYSFQRDVTVISGHARFLKYVATYLYSSSMLELFSAIFSGIG